MHQSRLMSLVEALRNVIVGKALVRFQRWSFGRRFRSRSELMHL